MSQKKKKQKTRLPTAEEAHEALSNPEAVKGRVRTVRALPYRAQMVYVRYMKPDYFEYLVVYEGQLYSGYNIITPREGETELSEREIREAAALTWMGGETTVDMLLGIKVGAADKKAVEMFENARESVEGKEDA